MASGNWSGGFSGRPFLLTLYVSEYSLSNDDILNNRTRCAWTLRITRTGNYNTYDAVGNTYTVDVGGVTYSGSWAVDFGAGPGGEVGIGGYFDIASGTATIYHNADGTKTISVSASANSGGGLMGNASLSGALALQTVPRATTPTLSSPTIDTGAALTLTLTPASSTFSHRLRWAFQPGTVGTAIDDKIVGFAGGGGSNVGTPEGASADGTSGNYYSVPAGTQTPTLTVPHAVFAQSTDFATRNVTITIDTYDGATFIGTKTVVVPVTLAASEKPTIAAITDAEATTSPNVSSLIGAYVQGVTTLALALTSPAGIHGSTIVSREIKVAGQTLTANGTTPAAIAASGTVPITATVTDSRGRVSDVTTKNVTVLAWAPPVFATAPVVKRALSGGTADDNGTYLKVDPADFSASSLVVASVQKNHIEYRLSYRLYGGSSWTVDGSGWIDPADTPSAIRFTGTALSTFGSASVGSAYEVLIEIRDVLATSALSRVVPKALVLLHMKGSTGVSIGARHSGASNPLEIWGRGRQASDGLTLGDLLDARDFATNAEALALTSTTKVLHPDDLKYVRDQGGFDTRYYTESEIDTDRNDRQWIRAIPSGISSLGATATLNTTTGVVTLPAGVTLIRIDGLFSLGYEYEIILDLQVQSGHATDNSAWFRMREGGVTNSSAAYNTAGAWGQYNAAWGVYSVNGGSIGAIGAVSGAGSYVDFTTTVRMRAFSENGYGSKAMFYGFESFTSGSVRGVRAGGYTPSPTSFFDGIEFWGNSAQTGLMKGKIRAFKRKII